MNIIKCENTKEIPSVQLDMFSINATYTVERVVEDFKRRFGKEPQTGYQWGNYLYIEIPGEK